MYQQAPWLYTRFQTPDPSLLERPGILEEDEGEAEEREEERVRWEVLEEHKQMKFFDSCNT